MHIFKYQNAAHEAAFCFICFMYNVFQQYLDGQISLSEEEKALIQSAATLKKLRKKQYLLQAGEVSRYYTFVAKGCTRTYAVDDKGMEHVLYFSMENWWTGDKASQTSGLPSLYNIDAIEDSELVMFSNEQFNALRKAVPAFNEIMSQHYVHCLIENQQRVHLSISTTAEEKYLFFINKYPGLATRVPQSMIASYLGITPETLSRIRGQLNKH